MSNNHITSLYQQLLQTLKRIVPDQENQASTAWLLLEKLFGKRREELIAMHHLSIAPEQEQQLHRWIDELKKHKPLQYILGQVPFLDLWIDVKPPILIPRPETESWCAELINIIKPLQNDSLSILDMCTGSGCLALALADAFPKALVVASDINPDAINLAQRNAEKNNLTNVHFILSDLFNSIADQKYDLIVSNPPYLSEEEWQTIEPNVKEWEDKRALVASDKGFYIIEQILLNSRNYLKNNNNVPYNMWIEIGYKQGPEVVELFKKYDYRDVKILKDYQGHDRVVIGKYIS